MSFLRWIFKDRFSQFDILVMSATLYCANNEWVWWAIIAFFGGFIISGLGLAISTPTPTEGAER